MPSSQLRCWLRTGMYTANRPPRATGRSNGEANDRTTGGTTRKTTGKLTEATDIPSDSEGNW